MNNNMTLKVKNIEKSYKTNSQKISILKNVSFEVPNGKSVAIVGASGSGKTTLLSLLSGIDKPDSGEIFYGDQNIVNFSEEDLTTFRGENIGIVFQQFHLIKTLTAIENICLPLDIKGAKYDEKLAYDLLEKVGLKERATHYPSQLSGGECQRIAIARAIIMKPKLILADEPSGNLDQLNGNNVMKLFFDLISLEGTSLVFVTHNLELAKKCDQVLKIQNGELFEDET